MVNPLISVYDLLPRLGAPDLVIVDCRWYIDDPAGGRVAYDTAHIPGAVFAHLDEDLSAPDGPGRHPLPEHSAFGEVCERLGIDRERQVVVYDDAGGGIAARLWWMLTNQGHPGVYILDGGLHQWEAIDGPMSDETTDVTRGQFRTRPWTGTVDRRNVDQRTDTTILIDARARERYRGDEEPIDPEAGHIPGAISLPLTENLGPDMKFLESGQLRTRFAAAGVTENSDVIAHCGSGVTACHNLVAMVVAGMPLADLYVGSWSDWSTSGMPVATGDDPR